MPVINNISCDLNERLLVTTTITTDGTGRGTPVNVSGWSIKVNIHKKYGDGITLVSYSTTGGTVTIGLGTDGKITFTIPNSDIRILGTGDYVYTIARDDTGAEADLTKGRLSISPV